MQRNLLCLLLLASTPLLMGQEPQPAVIAGTPEVAQAPAQNQGGTPPPAPLQQPLQANQVSAPVEQMPVSLGAQSQDAAPITSELRSVVPQPAETPIMAPVAESMQQQEVVQTAAPVPVESPAKEKMPELPAPQPAQFSPPMPSEDEIEITGIDTVDVAHPKGNWLYKRIWWEKAERLYEKIKQLADRIVESRMSFFAKRAELEKSLLHFYVSVGFNQGEFSELVSDFSKQLEQNAQENETEPRLQLIKSINQEKKNIEQLEQGSQSLVNLDQAIEDALMKLLEQLNLARTYEQQAWESFKAINRELNDKRARELYYAMDTYWRNLNSINSYLSDSFTPYFEQLNQKVQNNIGQVKDVMQSLKEKGIDIQKQAELLRSTPEPVEETPAQEEENSGIFNTILHYLKAPFVAIGDMIGSLMGSIFGSSQEEEEVGLARPGRNRTEKTQENEQ